jgi:hypothetical protein
MIDLRDDGTITIEFPDPTGTVTLRPPKFGAYRRLAMERERAIGTMNEEIALLPKLDPLPRKADEDTPPDEVDRRQAERERLAPIYRARVFQVQDLSTKALEAVWRFILIGTDDFVALADPVPPADVDEWPIELLVDTGDVEVNDDGDLVRTNPTILDSVMRHWGKARYRSGPTLSAVPN